jgi:glyoxylase-like metal-dependent hydrolase (beta-lactamase superfamily II)
MAPSRRDFLATTATAALAASLGRSGRAWAQQAQAPAATFTPIRRNVGSFTMRGGTIGWLVNPDAVVVVDSQFPAEATACLAGLNTRSANRGVDVLINTHHHGDHTAGNISFRGAARRVVAHTMAEQHMRRAPGGTAPGGSTPVDQLFPDTIFTHSWSADVGDERVMVRHHGRAHTSGDVVITFERANVAHMGDLMFHQRHPVVDRSAGAQMRNWMRVLDQVASDHAADTIYIFGHANAGLPVTGSRADLHRFRDYLGAVLGFVETQVQAGKSREEVLAMREPLAGFEMFGRFGNPSARDALTCAYEEVVGG